MAYKDPERQRAYAREHYRRNASLYKSRALSFTNAAREVTRAYIRELKETTPCTDCGINYPAYVMDFDHLGDEPKDFTVGKGVQKGMSLGRIKKEIAKCEVVCANCHRERTHQRKSLP